MPIAVVDVNRVISSRFTNQLVAGINGGFGQSTDTIGDYNGAPGIGPGEPFNMQLALKLIF